MNDGETCLGISNTSNNLYKKHEGEAYAINTKRLYSSILSLDGDFCLFTTRAGRFLVDPKPEAFKMESVSTIRGTVGVTHQADFAPVGDRFSLILNSTQTFNWKP